MLHWHFTKTDARCYSDELKQVPFKNISTYRSFLQAPLAASACEYFCPPLQPEVKKPSQIDMIDIQKLLLQCWTERTGAWSIPGHTKHG